MVTTTAKAVATPLGNVEIDAAAVDRASRLPGVVAVDAAHRQDHALNVQLPFLQLVVDSFSVVPLLVGPCDAADVLPVLESLEPQEDDLIVVSSDLSHYLDYETARQVDAQTAASIVALKPEDIGRNQACGYSAIGGLLLWARQRGWTAYQVDLRNSGDTAGARDRVVGYGAFVFA